MTDRIPWLVDMRGWELVGMTSFADTNWRTGLEIWALGNQRRLIEPDGPIVLSYEVGQHRKQKPWTEDDSRALSFHGEDD